MTLPSIEQMMHFAKYLSTLNKASDAAEHHTTQTLLKQKHKLLVRLENGQLSAAQSQFLQQATLLKQHLDSFSQGLSARPRHSFILGVDPLCPSKSLLSYFPRLMSELPNTHLHLLQLAHHEQLRALEEGRIDMLLRLAQTNKPPRTCSQRYSAMRLCWAAGNTHPLARIAQLNLEQVQRYRQIVVTGLPENLIINAHNCWFVSDREQLCELLTLGLGWCIAPQHWLSNAIFNGRLRELQLDKHYCPNRLNIELLWANHRRDSEFAHCLHLLSVAAHDG